MQQTVSKFLSASAAAAALMPAAVAAQDADELARQLANPIANLYSLPFQLNYDEGYGADGEGSRYTLNIQPVIPISLTDDWNLVSRTIIPAISQTDVVPGSTQKGYGDIVQSFFFSPKEPTAGGLIWGVGPVFLLPTVSDDEAKANYPGFYTCDVPSGKPYLRLVKQNVVGGPAPTSFMDKIKIVPVADKGFAAAQLKYNWSE